jgi:3-methyladenine DNA glycosylase AlkD
MGIVEDVDRELRALAGGNEAYAAFHRRIVNTGKEILGVRTPDMRRLAKTVAAGKGPGQEGAPMNAGAVRNFLDEADKGVYEHVLFAGMLIVYARLTDRERIGLAREYLKHADSWALIDLFAEKMKRYDRKLWWDFAVRCLSSSAEFTVRYGVIILMANYLGDESVPDVFAELRRVKHDGYYVKMGLAWLYAEAAVKHYRETLEELASGPVDPWTRRKAYQKMIESRRFTAEEKEEIRALRARI